MHTSTHAHLYTDTQTHKHTQTGLYHGCLVVQYIRTSRSRPDRKLGIQMESCTGRE